MKLIRVLAIIAFILSGYITWTTWSGRELAGCGQEGGGCEEVLHTKWGTWFGIPVSAGGLVVYGAVLLTLWNLASKPSKKQWLILAFLSVLASGAALWFAGLQLFVIRNICYFCMAVHVSGITMAILIWKRLPFSEKIPSKELKRRTDWIRKPHAFKAGMVGVLALAVLILGQTLSRQTLTATARDPSQPFADSSSSPEIPEQAVPSSDDPSVKAPSQDTGQSENTSVQTESSTAGSETMSHREIVLLNGSMKVTLGEYPLIGLPNSERVAAAFLDYTCPACRQLHPVLEETARRAPGRIGVVVLPMPLDAVCNPGVPQTSYQHQNACLLWRIALAVWNTNPQVFHLFDEFMFESDYPPTPEEAISAANRLVGQDAMEAALANPRLSELIKQGIRFFNLPQITRKSLPTLVSKETARAGVAEASQLLFELERSTQ